MTMYVVSVCASERTGPKINDTAARELALLAVSGKNKKIAEERVKKILEAILDQLPDEDRLSIGVEDVCLCVKTMKVYEDMLSIRFMRLQEAQDALNREMAKEKKHEEAPAV